MVLVAGLAVLKCAYAAWRAPAKAADPHEIGMSVPMMLCVFLRLLTCPQYVYFRILHVCTVNVVTALQISTKVASVKVDFLLARAAVQT